MTNLGLICVMLALQKHFRTGVNLIAIDWQATFDHGVAVKMVVAPLMKKRFNAEELTDA